MKSIEMLKRMLKTNGIYPTESAREYAKHCLMEKIKRRDRKERKRSQLQLEL